MNLKAVIFAAITIGAMGAILDIAVDISAALSEVHFHAADISFGKTVKSGITIGQDIVGSMANTYSSLYRKLIILNSSTFSSYWFSNRSFK